ncbi:MAG: hypothetical protein NTW28_30145 [Candidatus Solibacter sp.]|nr:hypothetical protein [Candidatus Solibacter sp.]
MRYALLLALAACAAAPAQSIVNPSRLRSLVAQLDGGQAGEQALRCEVTATRPSLNYSFRYQAGYTVTVPMNQYTGSGHGWTTLTRITPEGGTRRPVHLLSRVALPHVPKTNVAASVGGGYLLGEGAYNVRWMMRDDSGRVCRKSWRVDVHLSRAERKVKVAIPPDTVWEIGLRGSRTLPQGTDDTAALRMTIFLHATPLSPRRTRMRPNDMVTLMSTVSSLLERVPVRSVRLVLFNLDQQRELYRKEGFLLQDMVEVSQTMTSIELGLVDFQVLQNKRGHVDLLTDLVNREIEAQPPSDVVLFLGPAARYFDRVPQASLEKPAGPAPQFFYFQLAPIFRQPAESMPADTIKNALSRLGGRTILIHSPGGFAKAIERLEKGGRGAP